MSKDRNPVEDLRGATQLAVDATLAVTELVEQMHVAVAGGPALLGRPLERVVQNLLSPVYGSIRGITRGVGVGLNVALSRLEQVLAERVPPLEYETVLAVLNGVLGDYLVESKSPLAIPMSLRRDGKPFTESGATPSLLVMVHGSSMSDRGWLRNGHDHGEALARELGYTPVYVRYNSGLHVSQNGRELAELLEALVARWPVPLAEIAIVGHSMGGLVARSACDVARRDGHAWLGSLRTLITVATPHHGAVLERLGNLVHLGLGISRYSTPFARMARIRSAGVTDLRYGNLSDADWQEIDRFASGGDQRQNVELPAGVTFCALAASASPEPGPNLRGDGLVSVDSALGLHSEPARSLTIPEAQRCIVYGTGHLEVLGNAQAYSQLKAWLSGASSPPAA